jgi:hypothetical protein
VLLIRRWTEFRISCPPAKNSIIDKSAVATVSARPCPQGCSLSAGLAITDATTSVIIEIKMSMDESIPSPRTARLFAYKPAVIFSEARIKLPANAVIDAIFIIEER